MLVDGELELLDRNGHRTVVDDTSLEAETAFGSAMYSAHTVIS